MKQKQILKNTGLKRGCLLFVRAILKWQIICFSKFNYWQDLKYKVNVPNKTFLPRLGSKFCCLYRISAAASNAMMLIEGESNPVSSLSKIFTVSNLVETIKTLWSSYRFWKIIKWHWKNNLFLNFQPNRLVRYSIVQNF